MLLFLSVKLEEFVGKSFEESRDHLFEKIKTAYVAKRKLEDPDQILSLERYVVVNAVDVHWQDHLTEMEELRRSVGFVVTGHPLVNIRTRHFVPLKK